MALAGLYSPPPDRATEVSRIAGNDARGGEHQFATGSHGYLRGCDARSYRNDATRRRRVRAGLRIFTRAMFEKRRTRGSRQRM